MAAASRARSLLISPRPPILQVRFAEFARVFSADDSVSPTRRLPAHRTLRPFRRELRVAITLAFRLLRSRAIITTSLSDRRHARSLPYTEEPRARVRECFAVLSMKKTLQAAGGNSGISARNQMREPLSADNHPMPIKVRLPRTSHPQLSAPSCHDSASAPPTPDAC